MPRMPAEDVVLTWFDELSNWDRWGDDDRLGTLNHLTPTKRVSAAASCSDGVSVSCSWDIRTGRQPGATVENQRYMLSTGLGLGEEGRRNLLGGGRAGGAQEFIGMVFHGLDVTHLDSLAHLFWDGKMYNGVAGVDGLRPPGRAQARRARGVATAWPPAACCSTSPSCAASTCWPPTTTSTPRTSRRPSRPPASGSEPGDVLLLRIGESGARIAEGRNYNANKPRTGFQAACLPWLHERGVAMIGSDVAQDPTPTGYKSVSMPIHMVGIVAMGLWLIDNCQLEDLAADLQPPRTAGSSSSPGADPLPGRHRQPGQPARRSSDARLRLMRVDTPLLVLGRGPAALVVAKVAAAAGSRASSSVTRS